MDRRGRPGLLPWLEIFKDVVELKYLYERCTVLELSIYLTGQFEENVSKRSVERKLNEWGFRKYPSNPDVEELKDAIYSIFFEDALVGDNALYDSLINSGWTVSRYTVVQLRREICGRVRIPKEEHEAAYNLAKSQIKCELQSGQISNYGREHLRTHMRLAFINVTTSRIREALQDLDPAAHELRRKGMNRTKRARWFPGPNYIWSLDGYSKLDFVGIQIYACIDAYSRRIMWIYVGLSSHAQISVVRQYLEAISRTGYTPEILRTDRGTETGMLADAHAALRKANEPFRNKALSSAGLFRDPAVDMEPGRPIELRDCYYYGPSIKNLAIESWWGQACGKVFGAWIAYFVELAQRHEFRHRHVADHIAIMAVYIPIIRRETFSFAHNWNIHRIRKQPRRPDVIAGFSPKQMHQQAIGALSDFQLPADSDLLQALSDPLSGWEIDEYLPSETLLWCTAWIDELKAAFHIEGDITRGMAFENGCRKHTAIYLRLRSLIEDHMDTGQKPILSLSKRPTGGYRWQGSPAVVQSILQEARDFAGYEEDDDVEFEDWCYDNTEIEEAVKWNEID